MSSIETLSFGADVAQLLDLVANSLYSHSEIFLRELISNSSDALNRLSYVALSNNALYEGEEGKIRILVDPEKGTITIWDNGIGMEKQEVIDNLGTIAKSGTKAFAEMLKLGGQNREERLIGQFGVGFYASFVVASQVVVRTRKAGLPASEGVEWQSTGKGSYTIEKIHKSEKGTEVILFLKDTAQEFLEPLRLNQLIKKYSNHILWPIFMLKPPVEKASEDEESAVEKTETDTPEEQVNQATAIWALPKSQIPPEQYTSFYQEISHDFEAPLAYTHHKSEGKKTEYTVLLYIPKRPPFDLWMMNQKRGLRLYVRRVFIMEDAEHLLPLYLRFMRGVVDAYDLPLNVSREILQNHQVVSQIREGVTNYTLKLLENMLEKEPEKYQAFWNEFGAVLKEGIMEDFSHKDRLAKLLRFSSTASPKGEQNFSLQDYIQRMKPGQEKIYYLVADQLKTAQNSPLLEVFKQKDIEVLLMHHPIDEWVVQYLNTYEGKGLQSIAKGEIDLKGIDHTEENSQTEPETTQVEEDFDSLLKQLKSLLGAAVKDVKLSKRLKSFPVCAVFDENELSFHMQRLLKDAGQAVPKTAPVLEINPEHPLIQKINQEADEERMRLWAHILLDQALMAEGEALSDPHSFLERLNVVLTST